MNITNINHFFHFQTIICFWFFGGGGLNKGNMMLYSRNLQIYARFNLEYGPECGFPIDNILFGFMV